MAENKPVLYTFHKVREQCEQANAEAWPSQQTIATFAGYSSRAVRDYVDVLERVGIVRLRRERRPSGADRIYYAPGL